MELEQYCDYKDTGFSWLERIPKHWDIKRNKLILSERNERSTSGKEDLLSLWLADQVYAVVKDEEYPIKVLNIVQENITEYGKGYE